MYEEALAAYLAGTSGGASANGKTPRGRTPSRGLVAPAPPSAAAPTPSPSVVNEPTIIKAVPAGPPPAADPLAVVHHLEAWMPEKIAAYKLKGFIHDVGGELVESVPGRIHVRLGGKGCVYTSRARGLSWLLPGRKSHDIDMELRLQRADPNKENQLRITVVFRSLTGELGADLNWRGLCTQIFCDLRAYLMGQTNGTAPGEKAV